MRRGIAFSALIVGFLAVALTGCGGGGSSTSGPSSGGGGAVIQGQIVRAGSAALTESTVVVVLRTALGIGLAEAAVGPLASVQVVLVNQADPSLTYTTTTDQNGNFLFTNVAPGTYDILVTGYTVTPPASVEVGVGDTGIVDGTATGDTVLLTATVVVNDITDLPQNAAQLCHAINIANASNASLEEVLALRQQKKGWGRIAREVGAHPSVIGLRGNCSSAEIAAASEAAKGKGKGKKKGLS